MSIIGLRKVSALGGDAEAGLCTNLDEACCHYTSSE